MEIDSSSMRSWLNTLGLVAGILMPFFNIPLIIRIIRRKTSQDISLTWVFGVWICIVGMFPSSLMSHDMVLKGFGISNLLLFSAVVVVVWIYHKEPPL